MYPVNEGAHDVIVTVIGSGPGNLSSNPRQSYLYLSTNTLGNGMKSTNLLLAMDK